MASGLERFHLGGLSEVAPVDECDPHQGTYGTVGLAPATLHGTRVAVKRLRSSDFRDADGRYTRAYRRFVDEICLHSELTYPCIVQFLGVSLPRNDDESPGLVMEALQQTLARRCSAEPPLTRRDELMIGRDVSAGLAFLHNRCVLHCDLSTHSIVFSSLERGRCRAKIIDFGSCARLPVGKDNFLLPSNPGKPRFRAPETESAAMRHIVYGYRADCFSLGICLQEMVTRGQSLSPPEVQDALHPRRNQQHERMSCTCVLERVDQHHPLRAIISCCTNILPQSRPTAEDVGRLITGNLQELPRERRGQSGSEPAADARRQVTLMRRLTDSSLIQLRREQQLNKQGKFLLSEQKAELVVTSVKLQLTSERADRAERELADAMRTIEDMKQPVTDGSHAPAEGAEANAERDAAVKLKELHDVSAAAELASARDESRQCRAERDWLAVERDFARAKMNDVIAERDQLAAELERFRRAEQSATLPRLPTNNHTTAI